MHQSSFLSDFNQCFQYVTYKTRMNKSIDFCYGTVRSAYTSAAKPPRWPLGDSDHNTVCLTPCFRTVIFVPKSTECYRDVNLILCPTVLQREKCAEKVVKVWNNDSMTCLQGCFDCTNWVVFHDSCGSLDELTNTITRYVSFCVDTVVPVKRCKKLSKQ